MQGECECREPSPHPPSNLESRPSAFRVIKSALKADLVYALPCLTSTSLQPQLLREAPGTHSPETPEALLSTSAPPQPVPPWPQVPQLSEEQFSRAASCPSRDSSSSDRIEQGGYSSPRPRETQASPIEDEPPTPGPAAAAAALAQPLVPSSQKALLLELKGLQEEPVEGFRVTLVDEGDLYNWEVAIFGPPNTYYEGGYFKARLKFPIDYPYSPPAFRFLTKMWHPNIYETGDVCISILHPPVDDPQSGELPSERWNPTQNVRTILLSVISLLNEPNTFSPANVDASVMYRKWKESKGKDREYTDIIRKQVLGTKVDAERDGVKVPTTLAEYCVKTKAPAPDEGSDLFYDDYYEDGEPEAEADSCFGDDEDDSGTEES
ncbi:ubiquitin-conjugating enzyme E2 R1 [Crocuta crocuta]